MDGCVVSLTTTNTCLFLKRLTKIHLLTGMRLAWKRFERRCLYMKNLFDEDGLPNLFPKAPRLTVYKRELYDCAECIICACCWRSFPQFWKQRWRRWLMESGKIGFKPDVPSARADCISAGIMFQMHRWGQSQMFPESRALTYGKHLKLRHGKRRYRKRSAA